MKGAYRRLRVDEREEVSRGLSQGWSIRQIASQLSRAPSTISREVKRGGGQQQVYRATRGAWWAWWNARRRRMGKTKFAGHPPLRAEVFRLLRQRWSPEQIAERLRRTYPENARMQISPQTIYMALYVLPKGTFRKELLACLRQGHQRRHRRRRVLEPTRKPLQDMVSIVDRPVEADERTVVGHWEGDVLVGRNRQSVLGTLVERRTRRLILVPLKDKFAATVCTEFSRALLKIPRTARRTLTYDQGREMADHRRLTQRTQVQVYFAHPASPWERGTSEQTNGLIRQFFPKGTNFNRVSRAEIARVQRLMNGRPRRVLDYKTPDEAWRENVALET